MKDAYASGGLKLSCSNEQELYLHWDPAKSVSLLTHDEVLDAIAIAGYSSFEVDSKALDFLIASQTRMGSQPRQVCVARRKPAEIIVTTSTDKLKAWLTIVPAYGYPHPTIDELEAKLREQGIVYGIQKDVLQAAVSKGQIDKTLVAVGQTPEPGTSAWFEYLLVELQPTELGDDQKIDYKNRNQILSVEVNHPLMRRHPPTKGLEGRNIHNEVLPAENGRDYPLLESLGSKIAPEDPCLLVSTRSGRPIRQSRTVRIDDVLVLEQVDLSTGNINFKGSVHIKGSVLEGFEVRASGDIIVQGSVEDSVLESENNIHIYGSMFGKERARLSAGGNIQVTYIQTAEVDCLGDLFVHDGMFHCQSRVLGQIVAGGHKGKGQINGGEIWAGKRIVSRIIGSNSSTATRISLGEDPYLRQKLRDIDHNLRFYKSELEQVVKSIIYIRTRAAEKATSLSELESRRSELLDTVNHLSDQVQDIREHLNRSRFHCELIVHERIMPGVKLRLAENPRQIEEEIGPCRFYLENTPTGMQVRMSRL